MQSNQKIKENWKNKIVQGLKKIIQFRESGIAIPVIVLVIIFQIINPAFLNFENLMNILRTSSFIFLIGIGMTMLFISGAFDLSVGSVMGLGGVITGLALFAGIPIWLSIILGLLSGAAIGFVNAFSFVKFKIPPLIVTLGMLYIARSVVQVLTRGTPVYPLPDAFNIIGQGHIKGVPIIGIVTIVLAIIAHVVMTRTSFGRAIFAVGGNQETARLAGINVSRIRYIVFTIVGIGAALSGIFAAARLGAAQSNAGVGAELQVIAACIVGGTSLFGGSGSILGSFIGAVFMSVVANGMVLSKVSVFWQGIVIGLIIIVAVGMDQYKRAKSGLIGG